MIRLWHFFKESCKGQEISDFFRSYFGQCDDFISLFRNFLTFSLSTISHIFGQKTQIMQFFVVKLKCEMCMRVAEESFATENLIIFYNYVDFGS